VWGEGVKGVGERGRNDPNIVCTYELKKKELFIVVVRINIIIK
jgi:hypothetical protein